jgi:hypothetical protein
MPSTRRCTSGSRARLRALRSLGLSTVVALGACGSSDEVHLDPLPVDTVSEDTTTGAGGDTAESADTKMPIAPTSATETTTARFETLPVGAVLPDDEQCAALVRPVPDEVRPANTRYNLTPGNPTAADADPNYPRYGRVTGLHGDDRRDHPVGGLQVGDRRGRRPRSDGQGVVLVPAQRR